MKKPRVSEYEDGSGGDHQSPRALLWTLSPPYHVHGFLGSVVSGLCDLYIERNPFQRSSLLGTGLLGLTLQKQKVSKLRHQSERKKGPYEMT